MTQGQDQEWHWGEGTKYATEAIKSLFLLNGGSAVALLAFAGNLRQQTPTDVGFAVYAGNALVLFGVGALLAVLAFAAAYIAQLQYGNRDDRRASYFHSATYLIIIISIGCFLVGVFCARAAIIGSLQPVTP